MYLLADMFLPMTFILILTAADMMLRCNVRLLVIDENSVDINKPIGMITPLDYKCTPEMVSTKTP